jgi:hypothetical protein
MALSEGYRYTPEESVEVPFAQLFPYDYGGAGDITPPLRTWLAGYA